VIQLAVGGLVSGGVFAALGVCVVLMYRMLGVLNFAQAAIGGLGACATLYAFGNLGWEALPAVAIGLVAGTLLGSILGLIMGRFFVEASVETRSTVTIGLLVTFLAIGNRILEGSAHKAPDLLGSSTISVGGIGIATGSLVEAAGAIVLAVVVGGLLRSTRTGTQLRALSVRPTTAQLLGVPVARLTMLVWAFAGAVSTLAILLVLPTSTSNFSNISALIVPAMAAGLVGLLRSMSVAAVAGIAIGMLQSMALSVTVVSQYTQALPFIFITVVMIWWRRQDVWAEAR
jgi:branched-chain amino acid transport system permease protein